MFDRFTERARMVIEVAKDLAGKAGDMTGTQHVLLAVLAQQGKGMAGTALMDMGVTKEKFQEHLKKLSGETKAPTGTGPGFFSPRCKRALELAVEEAERRGDDMVGTDHLVIGLMFETGGVVHDVFKLMGVDPADVLGKMEGLRPRPKSVECRHATLSFSSGGFLIVCGNCTAVWAAAEKTATGFAFDARRGECNLGPGDIRKAI